MPLQESEVEPTEITAKGAEERIDRLSMKHDGRKYPDHNPERPG